MDDLLADFLTETNEGLTELDSALVKLERNPGDEATLSLIFRLVHTVKGTCGFLGLPRLEKVAHAAENVLGKLRDRQLQVTGEVITHVLAAIDQIKDIVATLGTTGAEPTGNDAALIAVLDQVCRGIKPTSVGAAEPIVQVSSAPEQPAPELLAPEPRLREESAGGDAAPSAPGTASQTIRVGVDVLEDLMTLVSELVLTRNQLLQLARGADGGETGRFTVPLQRLSHITSDLQEGVMKTRMQPIGNVWNKLPRLVRDLARELNKKIELVMQGADTELDRQVLELIKDPLTHMVRNSADHGLETPLARRAAGKPEVGQITLNAFHEGGHIIIEISDDGAGLSVERIKAKALANGLASEAELAAMTEAQIQRFIMRAGFSTAAAITAVSGRGVGMDVVKTNIEQIGGTIDLKSTHGQGTVFTIKIPLTLAIVSALIVQAGGERFAVPQISVIELVRARTGAATDNGTEPMLERINDTPVLRLRDQLLPLVSLTALLRLPAIEAESAGNAVYIVVTQIGGTTMGLIVDRVFDTEEIVVKPVAPILRHISMFSGNTILGDGSVIMILDPNGIARASGVGGDSRAGRLPASGAATLSGPTLAGPADNRVAMLLFRAGDQAPKAIPLGLIARLEDIAGDKIEYSAGLPVAQYRGRLMPLVPMIGMFDPLRKSHSVLVFNDDEQRHANPAGASNGGRCMGLVVDEIIDVVEETLQIALAGSRPGLLGTAVIAGNATDVIDIGFYLTQAFADWFAEPPRIGGADRTGKPARILVVEDSEFFRHLLVPTLSSAGYDVIAVSGPAQALRLHDGGEMFDAVVSDIEMPGMNGIAFVRTLREKGHWMDLPVIALTSHVAPEQIELGREAGFTDYVAKFERAGLLASLQQCLAQPRMATPMALAA